MSSHDGMQQFLAAEKEATQLVETLRKLRRETERYRDASQALEHLTATITPTAQRVTDATSQLNEMISSLKKVSIPELVQTRAVIEEQIAGLQGARDDLDALISELRRLTSQLTATEGHAAELAAELAGMRGEGESFTQINQRLAEAVTQLTGLVSEVSGTAAAVRAVSTTIREHGSPAVLQAYRTIEQQVNEVRLTRNELPGLQVTLNDTNSALNETAKDAVNAVSESHATMTQQIEALERRHQEQTSQLVEQLVATRDTLSHQLHRQQVRMIVAAVCTAVVVLLGVALLLVGVP